MSGDVLHIRQTAGQSEAPLANLALRVASGKFRHEESKRPAEERKVARQSYGARAEAAFKVKRLATPLDRLARRTAGRRSLTRTVRKRGRYIFARPMNGRPEDLAFDATLRAAAPFQRGRHAVSTLREPALLLRRQDLQRKVRVRRTGNLMLFVVDASWSVSIHERVEATKGAIISLLHDAYRRRDQVGLIVFREREARLVLPPTSSVELAQRALADVAIGGKTPLSAALLLAHQVCSTALLRDPEVLPLLIILTDGAANVPVTDMPVQEEVRLIANRIRDACFRAVVLNMEQADRDQGLAQELAVALGAPYHRLPELHAETLADAVRYTVQIATSTELLER